MNMKFDPEQTDFFHSPDGTEFEINFERIEHTANNIYQQYNKNVKKHALKHRKSKKKKHIKNIASIYNEWHVDGNDETLYLVLDEKGKSWAEMTSDNHLYPTTSIEE